MICRSHRRRPGFESRLAAVPDADAEAAYPAAGRILAVDGGRVHATDDGPRAGAGRPVILIHGANVNLRDWTYATTARLARTRRVIAMDRPGFGYSDRGPGDWTPARQAARLRAAAATLGAKRPVIVGHSWGAAVALAWALDAPESISGVVCVSGATMPWGAAADLLSALGVARMGATVYTEALARKASAGAVEAFVARAFTPQRPPQGYLAHVGAPLSLRLRTLLANRADLANTHRYLAAQARRYPALTAPVEILHGDADWLLSVGRHARGLADRLPDARVTIAPGVGHMAHHARPDLLEAAVARIEARIEARDAFGRGATAAADLRPA